MYMWLLVFSAALLSFPVLLQLEAGRQHSSGETDREAGWNLE